MGSEATSRRHRDRPPERPRIALHERRVLRGGRAVASRVRALASGERRAATSIGPETAQLARVELAEADRDRRRNPLNE
jgi:hypothetical protein